VPSPQSPTGGASRSVHSNGVEQSQLSQVEHGFFLVHAGEPDKLVENFSQPDRREQRITGLQQRPNLSGSWLIPQERQNRVRIQDSQRTRACRRSR